MVLVAVYVRKGVAGGQGGGGKRGAGGWRGRQMTSTNLQCPNQNYEYLYSVV